MNARCLGKLSAQILMSESMAASAAAGSLTEDAGENWEPSACPKIRPNRSQLTSVRNARIWMSFSFSDSMYWLIRDGRPRGWLNAIDGSELNQNSSSQSSGKSRSKLQTRETD
jgi:hypothetical protein